MIVMLALYVVAVYLVCHRGAHLSQLTSRLASISAFSGSVVGRT